MKLEEIKKEIKEKEPTTQHYLLPVNNNVKSYYNKAEVKTFNNIKVLYSYNTPVCYIYDNCKGIKYYLNYEIEERLLFSNTTLKHMKEFLLQNITALRVYTIENGKLTKNDIIKNNEKEF